MLSAGASASGSRRGAGILGNRRRAAVAAAAAAAAASDAAAAAIATAATINGGSHEGAATSFSGPTLTEADIRAITDAMQPVISRKVSSAVNDKVVLALSEYVKTTIKDTLQETMVGDEVAEVPDGVAAKFSEDMAPKIVSMVKKDLESTARPILDAIAGVTTALAERIPEFGAFVAGVNAFVLAAVAAQQQQTARAVLTYENISFEQIRRVLNILAPTRNVRRVEAAVAYKRIKRVAATPAAQKDFLTWLIPQPRHGGTSRKFSIYHSDKLTYVIAILQKMAVAERKEAEPTTQHRNEDGLDVRQATIVLLAESCRQ